MTKIIDNEKARASVPAWQLEALETATDEEMACVARHLLADLGQRVSYEFENYRLNPPRVGYGAARHLIDTAARVVEAKRGGGA